MSALDSIRDGLVVSTQAPPGSPMRHPEMIAALAASAQMGGARGIRAAGTFDVAAVRRVTAVPVVGLTKVAARFGVRITPTLDDALALASAGAEIVAVDATLREREDGEDPLRHLARVCREVPVPVLADVDSFEAAERAVEAGAAAVATTLSGYTEATAGAPGEEPDVALVEALARTLDCPVIAEGRYATADHVRRAFDAGAWAVVVGTAITDPVALTGRLAAATPINAGDDGR